MEQVDAFKAIVEIFQAGGPWAVTVAIGWLYIRERSYSRALVEKLIEHAVGSLTASTGMKIALGDLRHTLGVIAHAPVAFLSPTTPEQSKNEEPPKS